MKKEISIPTGTVSVKGDLSIPVNAKGLVIFSHGSGSGRFSKRNRQVADYLNHQGFATLLFDLLTEEEDKDYMARFDIELLSKRLVNVTEHMIFNRAEVKDLPVGFFGASTGAASAMKAAARLGRKISAVVSRGGRPDLAIDEIPKVTAPTLFIIGGDDKDVIELNRRAYHYLKCDKEIIIIPGATHLFEEQGKLEEVSVHAAYWFSQHMFLPSGNA